MKSKWLLVPVFAYLIFLSGMCFIGLGKFASLVLDDGWWDLTKDFASLLASISTTLGLPLAIWLYFKQRERDHDERIVQQLRELFEELTSVLIPEKLLVNQVVINSLLFRINSKRMEVDERNRKEFDISLITHINQLFKNIQPCNIIADYVEASADHLNSSVELSDLDEKYRDDLLGLAKCIVNCENYQIREFGTYKYVSFEKGFSAGLLTQLILIAQPICVGNFTNSDKDTSWDSKKLKNLFYILPFTIAGYIYLFYSDVGKNIIIELNGEK